MKGEVARETNLVCCGIAAETEGCSHGAAHWPRDAGARAGAHGVPRAVLWLVGPREGARKDAVGRAREKHGLPTAGAAVCRARCVRDEGDDRPCARRRAERGEGGSSAADVVEARRAVVAAAAEHVAEARGPAARRDGGADAQRARGEQGACLGDSDGAVAAAGEHEVLAHVDGADGGGVDALRRAGLLAAVESNLVQAAAAAANKQRAVLLVACHARPPVLFVVAGMQT